MVTPSLVGLRDVADVQGSFLLAGSGELVARDLPPVFDAEIFNEIGPRLVRLRETLESDGDDVSTLTLRFADHKLHLRTVGHFLLCVVTMAQVNGPALRMAINLVARRVASQGSQIPQEVPSSAAAAAPPPATPIPPEELTRPRVSVAPVGTRRAPGVMGRGDIIFKGRRL